MRLDPGASIKRMAIAIHRWLGVALCVCFVLWFASGIGMMYFEFPAVTPADRLEHARALDASTIAVPLSQAAAASGIVEPTDIRLQTFDSRPVYRFRNGQQDRVVFADTGERRRDTISSDTLARIAAAWTHQPSERAAVEQIAVDQWTVAESIRRAGPLWKYSWRDGEQVYVSQRSGDVVQYTTRTSRLGAYFGPIPHWFYFTPLRARQLAWSRVVIWSSGVGAATAILGIAIGVWMYSPGSRYRRNGVPVSSPYAGAKRWHHVIGLAFGVPAVTWAVSGMLSMDPFPALTVPRGDDGIRQSLRGRLQLEAFAAREPRAAVQQLESGRVKEIELAVVAGEPVYIAKLDRKTTRIVPMTGEPRAEFDSQRLHEAVARAAGQNGIAEFRALERYDRYYLDRRRERPLPVLVVRLADAWQTRYYVDPKTAQVVGRYSSRSWAARWLYHGLHSLDFPWLYDHRPLWDVVVITFMIGGAALSLTALIIAWRVLFDRSATRSGAGYSSTGSATIRPSKR